jgi:hypothetical protein
VDARSWTARPSRRLLLKWGVLGAGLGGWLLWRWTLRPDPSAPLDPGHALDALLKARLDGAEPRIHAAAGCDIEPPLVWERQDDVADQVRLRLQGHVRNRGSVPTRVVVLCALAAADARMLAFGTAEPPSIAAGATTPFAVENLLLPATEVVHVSHWRLALRASGA